MNRQAHAARYRFAAMAAQQRMSAGNLPISPYVGVQQQLHLPGRTPPFPTPYGYFGPASVGAGAGVAHAGPSGGGQAVSRVSMPTGHLERGRREGHFNFGFGWPWSWWGGCNPYYPYGDGVPCYDGYGVYPL